MWSGPQVDRYGYRFTFLITAALQLTSACILSSIAFLVKDEHADGEGLRVSAASSSGCSLLAAEAREDRTVT